MNVDCCEVNKLFDADSHLVLIDDALNGKANWAVVSFRKSSNAFSVAGEKHLVTLSSSHAVDRQKWKSFRLVCDIQRLNGR